MHLAGPQACQQAIRPLDRFDDRRPVGEHRDNYFGRLRRRPRRRREPRAKLDNRPRPFRRAVPNYKLVPRFEQPLRHRPSNDSQPKECDRWHGCTSRKIKNE